jgi:hypothetical protein
MQILLRLPDQLEVFVRLNTLSFITAYQQAALSLQIRLAVSVNKSQVSRHLFYVLPSRLRCTQIRGFKGVLF